MDQYIEFHDSTLTSVDAVGTSIHINLTAYIHRWGVSDAACRGTGWVEPVRIVLSDVVGGAPTELPVELDGGEIRSGNVHHDNLVPLPFASGELSKVTLVTVTGRALEFAGRSVIVESTGQGRRVEDLPEDLIPPPN